MRFFYKLSPHRATSMDLQITQAVIIFIMLKKGCHFIPVQAVLSNVVSLILCYVYTYIRIDIVSAVLSYQISRITMPSFKRIMTRKEVLWPTIQCGCMKGNEIFKSFKRNLHSLAVLYASLLRTEKAKSTCSTSVKNSLWYPNTETEPST